MSDKRRLDIELVRRGIVGSRSRARELIDGGAVRLNGNLVQKSAVLCDESDEIATDSIHEFVGRGGVKLEHALESFGVDARGKTVLDIGASTGGFVHCLLLAGANLVFAVDVGTGQLDNRLRNDERVVSMEGVNARYLTREMLSAEIDLIVCDVSFISLKLILPIIRELLNENGQAVLLVKPQFEAGRSKIGKKGIVKDKNTHIAVLVSLIEHVKLNGFTCLAITESPIKGGTGNIEFFMYLAFEGKQWSGDVANIVENAHQHLNRKTFGGGK